MGKFDGAKKRRLKLQHIYEQPLLLQHNFHAKTSCISQKRTHESSFPSHCITHTSWMHAHTHTHTHTRKQTGCHTHALTTSLAKIPMHTTEAACTSSSRLNHWDALISSRLLELCCPDLDGCCRVLQRAVTAHHHQVCVWCVMYLCISTISTMITCWHMPFPALCVLCRFATLVFALL